MKCEKCLRDINPREYVNISVTYEVRRALKKKMLELKFPTYDAMFRKLLLQNE